MLKPVRIYSLNVGGLNSKYDLGLIDNIFLNNDIICISETRTNHIENFKFSGFKAIEMPKKIDHHKFGGIHGLCVYVKDEIYGDVHLMNDFTQSESVLWFKLSNRTRSFSMYIGAVYVPHEASKYNHKDIFHNLELDVATLKSQHDIPFILIGDFHSRVGVLSDFISVDESLSELFGLENNNEIFEIFQNHNVPVFRANEDQFINENGKKLIEFCEITKLRIMNGRIGHDKEIGEFVGFTGMGKSAIDLVLGFLGILFVLLYTSTVQMLSLPGGLIP